MSKSEDNYQGFYTEAVNARKTIKTPEGMVTRLTTAGTHLLPVVLNIMIDIETGGLDVDTCPILQIGACVINTRELESELSRSTFKVNIGIENNIGYGRGRIENDTLDWLDRNCSAVQVSSLLYPLNKVHLVEAFSLLRKYILDMKALYEADKVLLWSKGADFDLVVLSNAFAEYGIDWPVSFREHRCARTIMAMFPEVSRFVSTPEHTHDALTDALYQAEYLDLIQKLHPHIRYT